VQIWTLIGATVAAIGFSTLFFKELRIAAFDPALATTQGFSAGVMHYLLMTLVAATTVASFEAVGSVLVIAMLICPAATARLLTDRLRPQMIWSVIIAIATSLIGYTGAIAIPAIWGKDDVNKAGGMALAAGGLLTLAIILSPRHGVVAKAVRRARMARGVALDDVLGALYRLRERGRTAVNAHELTAMLPGRRVRAALRTGRRRALLETNDGVSLTTAGLDLARDLVRRHRLWESYLVSEAGVSPDHVHETAERLEHLRLKGALPAGEVDPHGKPIPGSN
jgi:manganese/zinc/iron transport system permease protein